jgi:spore maturation protein CgeB
VPEVFARFAVTVHVPRAPYVRMLPGIPTIRVFEALACGIPLVCAPWSDCEGLLRPGDMLFAADGAEATRHIRAVLADPDLATSLADSGLRTIRERHTCAHRVDQLLGICGELGVSQAIGVDLEAVA